MGNAGVISHSPYSGFSEMRKPQASYYGGNVIVTSNQYTDGTFTPPDALLFNDYYDDPSPKTIQDHWGLLDDTTGNLGVNLLSVEYRNFGDMTIWFRGKYLDGSTTPIIKYEWNDFYRQYFR